MRYFALATDYDGTLAHDGIVSASTVSALERLRDSGRKLLLVTGREMPDLHATFDRVDLFDLVVAENGALLYNPATKEERPLAEPPPPRFAEMLRARGAHPVSEGRVIVATWDPFEHIVMDTIREFGLELQLIFNKGALMILPSGVNKAYGLKFALEELGLSAHNVVAVGDAENDHAFLKACECAVAVSNALPSVKDHADWITKADHGDGVTELIDALLTDDLTSLEPRLSRYHVLIGADEQGGDVRVPPYGTRMMVAGTSGGGKSTLTTGLLERLVEGQYQFCAIDPEGDYQKFNGAILLGDAKRAPTTDEIMTLLDRPGQNVIINLLGVELEQRPNYLEALLPHLEELHARTGRPHWLIFDEAHHLLPHPRDVAGFALPQNLGSKLLVTLEPNHVSRDVVDDLNWLVMIGEHPLDTLKQFANQADLPKISDEKLPRGEGLIWQRDSQQPPQHVKIAACHTDNTRHSRKYATAELTPDRSFFFRGPQQQLNLRAQNLMIFLQLMDGVDDETWLYHLKKHEYSEWFRENIKNDELAQEAETIEREGSKDAAETRKQFREIVEARYTLPA